MSASRAVSRRSRPPTTSRSPTSSATRPAAVVNHFDLPVSAAAGTTCFPTTTLPQAPNDSNMAMINNVTQDYSLGLEFTSDTPVGFAFGVINPIKPANGHTMKYTWYCRSTRRCGAPQPAGSGYTIPSDLFATSFPVPPADIAARHARLPPEPHRRRVFNNGNDHGGAADAQRLGRSSTSVTFGGNGEAECDADRGRVRSDPGRQPLFKKVKIPAGTTTSADVLGDRRDRSAWRARRAGLASHLLATSAIGGNVSWVTNQQLNDERHDLSIRCASTTRSGTRRSTTICRRA